MIGVGVGAFANHRIDGQLRAVVTLPYDVLSAISDDLQALEEQASYANITIPDQVVELSADVEATITRMQRWLPGDNAAGRLLGMAEHLRAWSFYGVLAISMLFLLVGLIWLLLIKDRCLSFFMTTLFISIVVLLVFSSPTLFLEEVAADVCIECNVLVANLVESTESGEILSYLLFCTNDTLTFMQPAIEETEQVLEELEEQQAKLNASDPRYETYEKRINQTEHLLELEKNLTLCDSTSEAWVTAQEEICGSTLSWNFTLTASMLIVALLEAFIIICGCCGLSTSLDLSEDNKDKVPQYEVVDDVDPRANVTVQDGKVDDGFENISGAPSPHGGAPGKGQQSSLGAPPPGASKELLSNPPPESYGTASAASGAVGPPVPRQMSGIMPAEESATGGVRANGAAQPAVTSQRGSSLYGGGISRHENGGGGGGTHHVHPPTTWEVSQPPAGYPTNPFETFASAPPADEVPSATPWPESDVPVPLYPSAPPPDGYV